MDHWWLSAVGWWVVWKDASTEAMSSASTVLNSCFSPALRVSSGDGVIYCRRSMFLDLTKLSEGELIELNRRIVERLQLMRSARSLTQLARFSVGMIVEFDTDDGRTISGTVARLNRRTATVVSPSGRWRVSPSLLRMPGVSQASTASDSRVVAMPRRRE